VHILLTKLVLHHHRSPYRPLQQSHRHSAPTTAQYTHTHVDDHKTPTSWRVARMVTFQKQSTGEASPSSGLAVPNA
jgi:hypothetical protein